MDFIRNDKLRLTIHKEFDDGFYYFCTAKGFNSALDETEFIYRARKIWIADKFEKFSTLATTFSPWGYDTLLSISEWQGLIDPRKLVRDLSIENGSILPHDIRPWLLDSNEKIENIKDSEVFRIWKTAASKKISLVLPSEIRFSTDNKVVTFKGEKTKDIKVANLSDQDYCELFSGLHECASWVFVNRHDYEIKHTLLNYFLASEWTSSDIWPNEEVLTNSLVAAQDAYKLHVREDGRELLKAFGDIKKALQDEVGKVADNIRSLVANFWRDFAIAAVALVVKFTTSSTNLSPIGIKIIFTFTAVFLLFSITVTLITNSRFNTITQENRNNWYKRLYPFIDKNNVKWKELVEIPIQKITKTYSYVAFISYILYMVISIYLLYLAFFTI